MSVEMKLVGLIPDSVLVQTFNAKWRHPWLKPAIDWAASRLRNREGVIQRGVGKGLRFDPGPAHASYLLGMNEPEMQHAMKEILKPGMTFFDVGATVGFHSMLAARLVGSPGRVVSFEPVPQNALLVSHNAGLNGFGQVRVRVEALGDVDVEAAPFVTSPVPTAGRLATVKRMPQYAGERIGVRLRKLDTVMLDAAMPAPDVIKIDVEGAETDVLRGATETIRRHRPTLMIELHGTNAPVAKELAKLDEYWVRAIEGSRDVLAAHWNAYVAAVPTEKGELRTAVERVMHSAPRIPRRL